MFFALSTFFFLFGLFSAKGFTHFLCPFLGAFETGVISTEFTWQWLADIPGQDFAHEDHLFGALLILHFLATNEQSLKE